MSTMSGHDKPFIISGALFCASLVLNAYMSMFEIPLSQLELLDLVSWILSIGGAIIFVSALINHRHHR